MKVLGCDGGEKAEEHEVEGRREGGMRRDSMKSIDGFCEGGCGGGGFGEEKFSGSGSGYFRVSRVE